MNEPLVTVNGIIMTNEEVMTVRIALEVFADELIESNKTEENPYTYEMNKLYLIRINDIRNHMENI